MGAVSAGLSVAGGVATSLIGARQAKKARQAIKEYKRQDLDNAYADLKVSTLGADFQREQLASSTASSMQALQSAGARGVLGGVGMVQSNNVNVSRSIAADLDRQQKEIDRLVAQDNTVIRDMQERREEADLAGLGNQLAVGQQNIMTGISTIAGGASAMAGTNMFAGGGGASSASASTGAAGAGSALGALGPMGALGAVGFSGGSMKKG